MINFKNIDLNKMPIKKIVILGQFAVILFLVRSCHLQDLTISSNGLRIKMYENKVNEFTTKVNEYGHQLATQDQMIVERDKDLEKQLLRNSELSKLNEQIKYQAETKIKNIVANYGSGSNNETVKIIHDTIIKDGDTSVIAAVPIGTKFAARDTGNWYSLGGSLEKEGVKFDSINFRSDVEVNIGLVKQPGYKGWLLGRKDPKVEIVNKNPYSSVVNMRNIKLEDPKRWWESGWIKFGAGFLLGGAFVMSF
jgi:hypothetical protein